MARSGQITVTTAGTAVRGSDVNGVFFALVAHPDNTDTVWVGDSNGDVSNANGYPLGAGGAAVVLELGNLNQVWCDADVNGEKVCWIKLR